MAGLHCHECTARQIDAVVTEGATMPPVSGSVRTQKRYTHAYEVTTDWDALEPVCVAAFHVPAPPVPAQRYS